MKTASFLLAVAAAASIAGALAALSGPAGAQTSDATAFYTPAAFSSASGEEAYRLICQGCHMPAGEGASGGGEYPALANNPKLAAAPYVAMIVLDGRGGMPGLGNMLSDRQIAEVTHYVRTHFGNDYPEPLTAEDVKALRR